MHKQKVNEFEIEYTFLKDGYPQAVTIFTRLNKLVMKNKIFFFLLLTSVFIFSCKKNQDEEPTGPVDNFDRQAMLINWADNIIIPAFTAFAEKTNELKSASEAFATDPSTSTYDELANQWEAAYLVFQDVSMFEIGKAEELRFTNNLNIYPTDAAAITDNIMNGGYNFELPSTIDQQGFPALDYLLFGIADNEAMILDFYQNNTDASKYLTYLTDLTTRIDDLAQTVLSDWNNGFRNSFVENSGNSATASVDKLTNDFIFYYEKHLRAGKIGIPAGVFSGDTERDKVEALYRNDLSKTLFFRAMDAVEKFFNGENYLTVGPLSQEESFKTYIEYLDVRKGNESLATVINNQFQLARTTAQELDDSFSNQIEMDNVKMLATYDQLQLNVVNIKVDMLQAFNINVDFVDADGD